MASFNRLPSGQWRAQVRRNGHSVSRSFRLKHQAETWAREQEDRIDKGETPTGALPSSRETLADLIDLRYADMAELDRAFGRSKDNTLQRLRSAIGATRVGNLSRDFFVQFGKRRAKEGAGPVPIGIDISFLGTIMEHAAAVHGVTVPTDQLRLGRIALHRLGLIARSLERDRRPTQKELDLIIQAADTNPRQIIPLGRIVKFAVATAMGQDEICRILIPDFNRAQNTQCIRQRMDPREKATNDQVIPLVADTGYDAAALISEQLERAGRTTGFIFPYDGRSVADPPPSKWSDSKYGRFLRGGPRCRRRITSRKRSLRSCARPMCSSHRALEFPTSCARLA